MIKKVLLIGLPLYGFLLYPEYVGAFSFFLNPIAMFIFTILNVPFFYDKNMYHYEWVIHPILYLMSNLIFWIPVAIMINRYMEKRKIAKGFKK